MTAVRVAFGAATSCGEDWYGAGDFLWRYETDCGAADCSAQDGRRSRERGRAITKSTTWHAF